MADSQVANAFVVDTSASPMARLRSVPLDAVRWTRGFWAERLRQTREVSLRRLWALAADPHAGHVLENLRIAAGTQQGDFAGTHWQDAWAYKWLEAAACIHRATPDPWIPERMAELIDLIAQAQEPDGYIATQITATGRPRFRDPRDHEVYTMGHLLTAAAVHHRMTGSDSLLKVARRAADFLCETLGVTVEPCFAHNPSAIMGLVELHRVTGEAKYLACARLIVDARGTKPMRGGLWHRRAGICGTDQIQDRVPLRDETEVVGHNVFFTYLFAGAADVYLETGDETLREALERLWLDLTARKMNVNGGVSPMGHGLSLRNDPVCEAVGPAWFVPSASAYNETCGQIGSVLWNYRLLCAEPRAAYADLMELTLYNGVLSGIGLDGASWWYRNPLRRYDADHSGSGHNDLPERELPGRRRICCPTNLLRMMAEWQSCLYGADADGLWIHHYGANELRCQIGDDALTLTQTTDYPWEGKIAIAIDEAPSRLLAVRLRIPAWARGASLKVNGVPARPGPESGSYVSLGRIWSAGDRIELDLPMPPRLMQAHPKAEALRNQVAVMRGPILYCLEAVDLPDGIALDDVLLPSDAILRSAPSDGLPFGIRVLEGHGLHRREAPWGDTLYRELGRGRVETIPLRLIPYFAWANRGPAAMSVWLPLILRA